MWPRAERRQFGRRVDRRIAEIIIPGRPALSCCILNSSVKGAFLQLTPPKWLPYQFLLKYGTEERLQVCEVRHMMPDGVGVFFTEQMSVSDFQSRGPNIRTTKDEWFGTHSSSVNQRRHT